LSHSASEGGKEETEQGERKGRWAGSGGGEPRIARSPTLELKAGLSNKKSELVMRGRKAKARGRGQEKESYVKRWSKSINLLHITENLDAGISSGKHRLVGLGKEETARKSQRRLSEENY